MSWEAEATAEIVRRVEKVLFNGAHMVTDATVAALRDELGLDLEMQRGTVASDNGATYTQETPGPMQWRLVGHWMRIAP